MVYKGIFADELEIFLHGHAVNGANYHQVVNDGALSDASRLKKVDLKILELLYGDTLNGQIAALQELGETLKQQFGTVPLSYWIEFEVSCFQYY